MYIYIYIYRGGGAEGGFKPCTLNTKPIGLRVWDVGFRLQTFWLQVSDLVEGLGCRVEGSDFMVWGLVPKRP